MTIKNQDISVPQINSFCRILDLIYIETGIINSQPAHWFLDAQNRRVSYSIEEIKVKLDEFPKLHYRKDF